MKKKGEVSGFYPHLKITAEPFPRLLATRKFLDQTSLYFGAYLPQTAFRIFFYRLIEIFKLRGCDLPIDGNFLLPCHLFFTKKCVAPCVSAICLQEEYADIVEALKLFLSGNEKEFEEFTISKIDEFSEKFEFEKAARFRDIWRETQLLKTEKAAEVSLENAVDTFSFEETEESFIVHLITTRGRKFLGDKEFVFEKKPDFTIVSALQNILQNFYRFHAPREIRLPADLPDRKSFEKKFRAEFNLKTKITIIKNELNTTAQFRFKRARIKSFLNTLDAPADADKAKNIFKNIFELKIKPSKIEVFDAAHLANQDFVTASAVWENGVFKSEKKKVWKVDASSEPQALAQGIFLRLQDGEMPDLILTDGGKGQINAVARFLEAENIKNVNLGGIVKPQGKHNGVAYFISQNGTKTEFIEGDKTFEILRRLRDEAHLTANELHRNYRANKHIFAMRDADSGSAAEIPLVLIRYDEIGGAAEDLQPLKTLKPNRG